MSVQVVTEKNTSIIMSCKLQQDRISAPMFKDWIQRHKNNYKASGKVCQKAIDLSNMGRGALISHSQGKGHKKQWLW